MLVDIMWIYFQNGEWILDEWILREVQCTSFQPNKILSLSLSLGFNDTRVCSFKDISCSDIAKNSLFIGKINAKLRDLDPFKCTCLPSCYSIRYNVDQSQSDLNPREFTRIEKG
jgi:hypothetical protein